MHIYHGRLPYQSRVLPPQCGLGLDSLCFDLGCIVCYYGLLCRDLQGFH